MPGDYVLRDEAMSPTVGGASVLGITDDDDDDDDVGSSTGWSEEERQQKQRQRQEPVMVQVPEGHVWVAGDSLAYSRDSRFYGPVPMALVTGKALFNGDGWFNWRSFRGPQLMPTVVGEHEMALAPVQADIEMGEARPAD
jgi:hypothetical protein